MTHLDVKARDVIGDQIGEMLPDHWAVGDDVPGRTRDPGPPGSGQVPAGTGDGPSTARGGQKVMHFHLGEEFDVYLARIDRLVGGRTIGIHELADPVHQVHVQVKDEGKVARWCARVMHRSSRPSTDSSYPGEWVVCQFGQSDLAVRIEQAIRAIDDRHSPHHRDVSAARLLTIPAVSIEALWLDPEDLTRERLWPLQVPGRPHPASLEVDRYYTSSEFVSALRGIPQPVGYR